MSESSPPSAKRLKTEKQSPTTFVTWNCNGFVSRAKANTEALQELLTTTNAPDMICLQEARLKACDPHQRGRPMPSEYAAVQGVIEGIFKDYKPVWSLADNRYAGTLTLIHKRLGSSTSSAAFTTESAVDLLLQRYNGTRTQVGLKARATPKVVVPETKAPKQTSMKSFFAPKKTAAAPAGAASTGKSTSTTAEHHPEGRFQFFSFPDMDVLQTYVPNNGMKDESFQKRKDWDQQLLQFLKDRRTILKHFTTTTTTNTLGGKEEEERPLLWCGDLNVANEHLDGTHWHQRDDGTIYEYWTDEAKCIVGGKPSQPTHKQPEDVGMPSFTKAERQRFGEVLRAGDLCDVWRTLHPSGVTTHMGDRTNNLPPLWDQPNYTWRGHLAKPGAAYPAKYQGKAQRLDYFLLSQQLLMERVESCDILGFGEQREGLFCGSDHCASLLTLK